MRYSKQYGMLLIVGQGVDSYVVNIHVWHPAPLALSAYPIVETSMKKIAKEVSQKSYYYRISSLTSALYIL